MTQITEICDVIPIWQVWILVYTYRRMLVNAYTAWIIERNHIIDYLPLLEY